MHTPAPNPQHDPTLPDGTRPATPDNRTRLEAAELRAVLDLYGIEGIGGVRAFERGNPAAPKALIESASGKYLLKRRAPGFDDFARIRAEHEAQIALQSARLPVPAPVSSRDGDTLVIVEGRFYELFPYVEAEEWSPGPEPARVAGETLAGIHRVLAKIGTHATGSESDHRAHVEYAFRHLAAHHPNLRGSLDRLEQDWSSALGHRAHHDGRIGPVALIHGDYHPGNTLWRGNEIVAVIDFETMRPAALLEEAAIAGLHFALDRSGNDPAAWPDAPEIGRLEKFWIGYDPRSRIDDTPFEVLPWLMIERLITEAAPRACRTAGFGRHAAADMLPFIARTTSWLADHADGVALILSRAGH